MSVTDIEKDGRDAGAGPDPIGGMLFVRAANEGRTGLAPRDPITQDFSALADRLLGRSPVRQPEKAAGGLRIFGRLLLRPPRPRVTRRSAPRPEPRRLRRAAAQPSSAEGGAGTGASALEGA